MLGEDELMLVINKFKQFHNNLKNQSRGGQKEGYFTCGDPDHFIANFPKMKGKYDSSKHKEKHEYTSSKHNSRRRMFNKKVLKKLFYNTTKAQERAFFWPPSVTSTSTSVMTLLPLQVMASPKGRSRTS